MDSAKLNLARKWRSRNFIEIVGQELSIRMLKNSLYLQHYFPVYLFSGQRGCGKTTTARVFAAAINCEQLPVFQKNPQKISVPCLECASCKAMEASKHPDFIEIDAASHTGVDNVRMLIDSASLLPLMGRKKIYLIDEAHMLSKAAFNAFLKIMEEPPASVLFILATTDPQKIIETVRSRCFQLFFGPVEALTLQEYLVSICKAEHIAYDIAGISVIIKQTEGSVRDAINLLEQVRFSSSTVSRESVLRVLGHMDDAVLIALFERTLCSSPSSLLQFLRDLHWEKFSAPAIWERLIELVRAALWVKYDVEPAQFAEHVDLLKNVLQRCTSMQLHAVLQTMCEYESLFAKTTAKHEVLEMMLLQICHHHHGTDSEGGTSPSSSLAPAAVPVENQAEADEHEETEDVDDDQDDDVEEEAVANVADLWQKFVADLSQLSDPLISSIFSQGVPTEFHKDAKRVDVTFSKDFIFFKNWIEETAELWRPIFEKVFGLEVAMNPLFTLPAKAPSISVKMVSDSVASATARQPQELPKQAPRTVPAKVQPQQSHYKKSFAKKSASLLNPFHSEASIDISDVSTWKKAHMLLRYIPGTITEIRE